MDAANTLEAAEARNGSAPEAPPQPITIRMAARRLGHYVRPHALALGLAVVLFFAGAAIDPLLPALFKLLIDSGFKGDGRFPIAMVPVAIVGLFAVRGLFNFCASYLMAWATSKAVLALRSDLIQSVMRADASLFVSLSPGVAASRVIQDPQNATSALAGAATTLLRDGTTLVALVGYLFYLNWRLTLVSLVTLPLLAIVVRVLQKRVLAVSGRSWESQMRLIGIVDDIARAWRVVRTFDAGEFERRRFDREAQRLRQATMKATTAGAMMTPLTQVITSIGVAIIVTLALLDAHRGAATVGDFVAFITTLLMTVSPLRHLTDVTQPIIGGLVQARACFSLMDTKPEPDPGTGEIDGVHQGLRFSRATVRYPGNDRPAIDGIDLDIPASRTVAFVGASGSGKTTVVSTLLGFADVSGGEVWVDDTPLREIRKASLRRQFAVVSQDIVLFDGSIEDNVVYAQPKDPARVEACLKAANLWDFVRCLPEGMATSVGTNGSRLSGGQRQRLAIARALYKDASVWIFDEATSALDSESERAVHQAIERWRGRKTLILIAHRLSTVVHADCIYVLREGRVVESGRHDALMARDGVYAGMVRAQAVT